MFRILLICVFASSIVLFVWHARSFSLNGQRASWLPQPGPAQRSINGLRKIALLLAAGSLLLLVFSGFLPNMVVGAAPSGLLLLIHVAIAPLFAVSLMLWIVLSAHNNAMQEQDWRQLVSLFRKSSEESVQNDAAIRTAILKICFWCLAILAVPVSLTVMLSMTTLLGTSGQNTALSLHKYSALAFFLIAVVMAHFVLAGQRQNNPSKSSSKKQAAIDASAKN